MKRSLELLDEIIEKAEYDNHRECIAEGAKFENFYVFNLKNLKKLIEEESKSEETQ